MLMLAMLAFPIVARGATSGVYHCFSGFNVYFYSFLFSQFHVLLAKKKRRQLAYTV